MFYRILTQLKNWFRAWRTPPCTDPCTRHREGLKLDKFSWKKAEWTYYCVSDFAAWSPYRFWMNDKGEKRPYVEGENPNDEI